MKNKIYLLTYFLFVFLSCTKEENSGKPEFIYSYFEINLKADMTYDSIVTKFGEPVKDIGSGIHIYVYKLVDSTEVWIGYTTKILYAHQVDKNGQILHTIIGDKDYSRTYEYFKNNLRPDMNYDSIVLKFGEPSKVNGSGIHIYVYELIDSTEIWIGYAGKIQYAKHVDKNRQILDVII